jgi:hypothetical protein
LCETPLAFRSVNLADALKHLSGLVMNHRGAVRCTSRLHVRVIVALLMIRMKLHVGNHHD